MRYSVSQAARLAGVSVRTLRWYGGENLLHLGLDLRLFFRGVVLVLFPALQERLGIAPALRRLLGIVFTTI